MIPQETQVMIDISDHSKKIGVVYIFSFVRHGPFWIHPIRPMRGICGDIKKKWIIFVLGDESQTFAKPHIRAIAIKFLKGSLTTTRTDPFVSIIKIIISPVIGCLSNSSATMPYRILKPPVLRAVWSIVSQMPFACHSCLVTIFRKMVGDCFFRWVQHGSSCTGSVGTGNTWMVAGHQCCPCGRAKRTDMKVCKSNGF